jgi:hypothetical protein
MMLYCAMHLWRRNGLAFGSVLCQQHQNNFAAAALLYACRNVMLEAPEIMAIGPFSSHSIPADHLMSTLRFAYMEHRQVH